MTETMNPTAVHCVQRHGVEVVPALPATPLDQDELCIREHAQVLHDGKAGETREGAGKLPGGARPAAQSIEHSPADRVGQRPPENFLISPIRRRGAGNLDHM